MDYLSVRLDAEIFAVITHPRSTRPICYRSRHFNNVDNAGEMKAAGDEFQQRFGNIVGIARRWRPETELANDREFFKSRKEEIERQTHEGERKTDELERQTALNTELLRELESQTALNTKLLKEINLKLAKAEIVSNERHDEYLKILTKILKNLVSIKMKAEIANAVLGGSQRHLRRKDGMDQFNSP